MIDSVQSCAVQIRPHYLAFPQNHSSPPIIVPNQPLSLPQNGFIENGSPVKSQSSSSNYQNGRIEEFAFRIKANFGDKKVRFRVAPECSFLDFRAEIARRFGLDDLGEISVKYLDDDGEWVLLTCNADLQESFELHRQFQNHTMRLCLQQSLSAETQ